MPTLSAPSAETTGVVPPLVDFLRCPPELISVDTEPTSSSSLGYFDFAGVRCFGRAAGVQAATHPEGPVPRVESSTAQGRVRLPFDLGEVAANLREERYRPAEEGPSLIEAAYYRVRPVLPVALRKHLQRIRLRNWKSIPFPRWPVDTSVDDLMRAIVGLALPSTPDQYLPFIWFWPDGAPSCTTITHDVEGPGGEEFVDALMDLDGAYGITAAYQLIPEKSGDLCGRAERIRARGGEVNIHDLNHDGRLYRDRNEFTRRMRRINGYASEIGSSGFRAGAMYRQQAWYDELGFEYDMSVPNVAHLEPQRGGCCTVFPYFVGELLELPLTTTQDYSLFFILNDYSITLWKQQIDLILQRNGLISIITHPDYLTGTKERRLYAELLGRVRDLREAGATWIALPGDINRWWRERRQMTLAYRHGAWKVEGPGSARARVAYARLQDKRVQYSLTPPS